MPPALVVAAVLAGLLLVASLVPSAVRGHARAVVLTGLVLAPPAGVGFLLGCYGRGEPGGWLLLLPVTFVWLAFLDLRFGVAARLARMGTPDA